MAVHLVIGRQQDRTGTLLVRMVEAEDARRQPVTDQRCAFLILFGERRRQVPLQLILIPIQ